MDPEPKELVRAFLRKWSTHEVTEDSKPILKEDLSSLKTMLSVLETETDFLELFETAKTRKDFAMLFQEFQKND